MTSQAEAVRPSRNPGAASRAAAALQYDPARSDRLIALAANCDPRTARRVRRELEAAGEIPRTTQRAQRTALPRRPGRASLAVMRGARTTREVAAAAGVSRAMAWRALHDRRTTLAELAAATDQLSVQAAMPCPRCGTVITFDPRKGPRKACSGRCGMALGRAQRQRQRASGESPNRWPPPVPELPPAPDFSQGWCTRVKPHMRSIWTSSDPGDREAAAFMCSSCPVREPCEAWSLALPASDPAIYAGLSQAERVRRRRAWLLAIAQQVRNPRT